VEKWRIDQKSQNFTWRMIGHGEKSEKFKDIEVS
jgi:hypothetical protein